MRSRLFSVFSRVGLERRLRKLLLVFKRRLLISFQDCFIYQERKQLSLLSAGSKSAPLSPPLIQKESGKKSLIAIMRSQEGYWIVLSWRQIWRHSKEERISCLYHRKAVPAFTINSRFDTVIIFDYEHVEYMTRRLPCSRLEHMRRQQ